MEGRNYVQIASKYARDVDKGREVAGKLERLACRRFLSDLKRAKKKGAPFTFDEWYASDPCDFIEKLPHVEGEWETPTLVLEPWQIFILVNIFGFRSPDGTRRFNTAYIEVGRKNGKSAFTSGITLYCLTCENEVGPQVKTAATTGDQARIVFDVCKKMADATPDFRDHFDVEVLANAVVCNRNGGSIKPINAKASTQDGLNPHMTVIDELHAHKDRKLFDVLKSARGARKNPLSWYITTAGYDMVGVCYEQREFVRKMLEGVIEADHYFSVVFTLDKDDDWTDERLWRKANPNIGVSVSLDEMRTYCQEAQESPASEGEFRTKRCNQWLNAASAWISMAQWARCEDDTLRIEDFEGREVWVGSDLANKDDITAVLYLFEDGEDLVFFPEFYLPAELVKAAGDRSGAPYKAWKDAGYLQVTDGNMTDNQRIEDDIRSRCEHFDPDKIWFDRYGAFDVVARLEQDNYEAELYPKNAANYTDAANDLEARYPVKRIRFPPNPVMTWMMSNAVIDQRVDGSKLPKKPDKNSPLKIDGVDALLTAMSAYLKSISDRSYLEDNPMAVM